MKCEEKKSMITEHRNIPKDFFDEEVMKPYDEVFELICKSIHLTDSIFGPFFYCIDPDYVMDTTRGCRYENLTPAYEKILKSGIVGLKYSDPDTEFKKSYNRICDGMVLLVNRIISYLSESCLDDKRITWFRKMIDVPATHFDEAIQRMLFVNQLFWQTDHRLVGLGAWDSYLWDYYYSDVNDHLLTRDSALELVESVFKILHENYTFKSSVLMGDTGQIFVLGKTDPEGNYIYNELTYLFVEAQKNVHQPDPKCLLRINKKTPHDLLEKSLQSIATGVGAPLFANDEVIIPCLTKNGFTIKDAYDYTTSACWEPLMGGKSACNNNRTPLNYYRALDNLFKREKLENIISFEKLIDSYLSYLKKNLNAVKRVIKNQVYQNDTLLSVFTFGCFESEKDVCEGGALYGDLGITSVGMGNVVDSLLNIKKYVFEQKKYSLFDVKKILAKNYTGYEDILSELKSKKSYYGTDEPQVVELTQRIMDFVSEELNKYYKDTGERIRIGLSGSAYLESARGVAASFDGRQYGEPFTVHISNDSIAFTELVGFASQLNYLNCQFNGNVIDIVTSPGFINSNLDKMILFIKGAVESGFFEMQMNVVDSKTLIEAKNNPESFPNLIVRVWGFSAYFKDLPEEYKDVLIKRALDNEKKVA